MEKHDRNKRKVVYGSEIEFFDGRVWKNISEYKKGDKMLTFFWEDNHVELLQPLQFSRVNKGRATMDKVIFRGIEVSTNMDFVFMGDYRNGQYDDELKTICTLKEAIESNFMLLSHINMYASFTYDSKFSSMLSEDKLRVMMISLMVGEVKENECSMIVNEGLKEHIRGCLKNGGMVYNINKVGKDYLIKYRLPRDKKLFIESPLMLSSEEVNILIDEIEYLSKDKRKLNPTNRDSFDFIQMLYALSGRRVEIMDKHLVRENRGVFVPERKTKVEQSKEKVEYTFTTKSGYVVLRSNGKIFVGSDYKK